MGQLGHADGEHHLAQPGHEETGDVKGRQHASCNQFPVSLGRAPVDDFGGGCVEQHIFFMPLGFLEGHDALERVAEWPCNRMQGGMWVRDTLKYPADTPCDGRESILQAGDRCRLVTVGNVVVQVTDVGVEPVAQIGLQGLQGCEFLERLCAVLRDIQGHGLTPFGLHGNQHHPGQLCFPQIEIAECHGRGCR
ncbi:hypothetical protein D3C76_852310 [compost metagenome]